jgi:hypothetical protein
MVLRAHLTLKVMGIRYAVSLILFRKDLKIYQDRLHNFKKRNKLNNTLLALQR